MQETAIQIPLSWKRIDGDKLHTRVVQLHQTNWLSLAEVPIEFNLGRMIQNLGLNKAKRMVIRGCNHKMAKSLQSFGFKSAYVGSEAVLDLSVSAFHKKSLSKLANRGLKKGTISEIPFSVPNKHKLEALKKASVHGKVPQLKNLFRNQLERDMRAFIYKDHHGEWLAAITLSKSSTNKMQTELLLRKAQAPAGAMEAVIQFIERVLMAEGWKFWSLGEVPFIPGENANSFSEHLIQHMGRGLRFAYNYDNLFHFKNKFNPDWQPVFLCAKPNVSLAVLYTLFIKSNLLKLTWTKMYRSFLSGMN